MNDKEKLMRALGEVDDGFVEESAPAKRAARRRAPNPKALSAVAAALAVSVLAGALVWSRYAPDNEKTPEITSPSVIVDDVWPELIIQGQEYPASGHGHSGYEGMTESPPDGSGGYSADAEEFAHFILEGRTYYTDLKTLDKNKVGGFIGDAEVTGYALRDFNWSDQILTAIVKMYEIDGINPECAVALRLVDREEYKVFVNFGYHPETFGDFIDALNLSETLSLGEAVYFLGDGDKAGETWLQSQLDYRQTSREQFAKKYGDVPRFVFSGVESSMMQEMLFPERETPNVYDVHETHDYIICIHADVDDLEKSGGSIWLTSDGYLATDFLSMDCKFYIGEDTVEAFKAYMLGTASGADMDNFVVIYRFMYIDPDAEPGGVPGTDEIFTDSGSVVTAVTSTAKAPAVPAQNNPKDTAPPSMPADTDSDGPPDVVSPSTVLSEDAIPE